MSKNPYGQPPPPHNPYSPPPSQPPQGYHPPQQHMGPQVSPLAIVSLVTGIMSLPLSFCCGCFSLPLSMSAVICGAIAIPQCKSGRFTGQGMAVAGLACGGVALLLMVGLFILNIVFSIGGAGADFQFPDF